MSQVGCECEDCGMVFESEEQLSRHKAKFCLNSKYANEEVLNSEFQKLSQGKNISLLGKSPNRSFLEPAASAIRQPKVQSFLNGYTSHYAVLRVSWTASTACFCGRSVNEKT